jgi:hypothetical protein
MKGKKDMLIMLSTGFIFGSVTLLVFAIGYVLRTQRSCVEPAVHSVEEPDALWVLGLEEALASL